MPIILFNTISICRVIISLNIKKLFHNRGWSHFSIQLQKYISKSCFKIFLNIIIICFKIVSKCWSNSFWDFFSSMSVENTKYSGIFIKLFHYVSIIHWSSSALDSTSAVFYIASLTIFCTFFFFFRCFEVLPHFYLNQDKLSKVISLIILLKQ